MGAPLLSTKQFAIKHGHKYYEGQLCKYGHGTKRYTKGGNCVECKAMFQKRWVNKNPLESRQYWAKYQMMYKYKMTPDEWLWMYKEQSGKCNIEGCEKTSHNRWWDQGKLDGLVVDHCHKTGRVRGLICTPHNTLIGWIEKLGYTTLNALSPTMEYLK
tara:strand:+ start:81 stop:554 length:474 start_codon:yes stop_codon:yes gene_type:complete